MTRHPSTSQAPAFLITLMLLAPALATPIPVTFAAPAPADASAGDIHAGAIGSGAIRAHIRSKRRESSSRRMMARVPLSVAAALLKKRWVPPLAQCVKES